ncbi:MAG: hypothetical protein ACLFU9_02615 [Candidatus Bathyarchaeia archaeon]
MKIIKKEIAIAVALALTIIVISIFQNTAPRTYDFGYDWGSESEEMLRTMQGSSSSSERVRIMDANIQGILRDGTFETVVPVIEHLVWEKGGFIVTERLTFKEDLWKGEIVSKLPPVNASFFTMATRQKIDENGRVISIYIEIRDFIVDQHTSAEEQYSTVKILLTEEFDDKETPAPLIQLGAVIPILVTGLVWVAGGLIVGVPLCFVSLGIVMLARRIIIPLWKKELSNPT